MSNEPVAFIVDDDVAFSESLSMLVSSMGVTTQAFASPIEYLAQFDPDAPGVLLLDVRMPMMSGLVLQQKLNAMPICPSIVFLTGYAEFPIALRAMQQGAVDFLQKTASESELYDAIQRGIAQDAAKRAKYRKKCELTKLFSQLNGPEKEVLEHVLRGVPNKQIASLLGVSRRTVEDRRARVMQKLDVESLAGLVRLAVEANFPPTCTPAWE
jgi:FixJ family two-component response regulator